MDFGQADIEDATTQLLKLRFVFFGFYYLLQMNAQAASVPVATTAKTQSLDELYDNAKKEGGQLALYSSLSVRSEEEPKYEKLWKEIFQLR